MSAALELRFLRDGGQEVAEVAGELAAFLGRARRDVAVAIYDFRFGAERGGGVVAETLQRLQREGVRVRVADHDEERTLRQDAVPRPPQEPEYVDGLGLDVHPVTGYHTLMHHKFAVVDGEWVWTGSLNWTDDSFTRQENCVVRLRSPGVAAAYLQTFDALWATRHPDGSGAFDTAWQELPYGEGAVRVRPYFCPGRGPELAAAIAGRVRTARRRIAVCSPVLTSGPILGALADVVGLGKVPIIGVVDATQMHEVLGQWSHDDRASWKPEAFKLVARRSAFGGKRSVPWGPGRLHDYLHAKVVVCDDAAFVGSYNHSRSGEENAENVLELEGAAVADELFAFVRELRERYPGSEY